MLTPDLDEPIGGVKIHYQVVDTLNRAGIDALVVHRRAGLPLLVVPERHARRRRRTSLRASRHDVVVVPEEWIGFIPDLPIEIPKVVFHQNAYSTFSWGVEMRRSSARCLQRPDVKRAVVVSEDNACLPALRVSRPRRPTDALHHRPDRVQHRRSQRRSNGRSPTCRDVERRSRPTSCRSCASRGALERLAGRGHRQHARSTGGRATLRESAIFLSFSLREGLPLPPAEAMACGCVVIGFHGFGWTGLRRQRHLGAGGRRGRVRPAPSNPCSTTWESGRAIASVTLTDAGIRRASSTPTAPSTPSGTFGVPSGSRSPTCRPAVTSLCPTQCGAALRSAGGCSSGRLAPPESC